jgi:ATP-dependent exoDNAse (exonuclease V) beta subunit
VCQAYDTIQALYSISVGLSTAEELIDKIKSLFSDSNKKGISLSTIHKAKGLESDSVFICCPSLMPAKNAKEAWEKEQERNLEYVAYTRAKTMLAFLDEKMFSSFSRSPQEKVDEVNRVKNRVFDMYGDVNRCQLKDPSPEAAKNIISNASDVYKPKSKTIDLNNGSNKKAKPNGQIVMPTRKKKKKK